MVGSAVCGIHRVSAADLDGFLHGLDLEFEFAWFLHTVASSLREGSGHRIYFYSAGYTRGPVKGKGRQ